MDELEKWLAPLGLATLAPTLRANDIDLDILPALSEMALENNCSAWSLDLARFHGPPWLALLTMRKGSIS